jgi:hypothetical protein
MYQIGFPDILDVDTAPGSGVPGAGVTGEHIRGSNRGREMDVRMTSRTATTGADR